MKLSQTLDSVYVNFPSCSQHLCLVFYYPLDKSFRILMFIQVYIILHLFTELISFSAYYVLNTKDTITNLLDIIYFWVELIVL